MGDGDFNADMEVGFVDFLELSANFTKEFILPEPLELDDIVAEIIQARGGADADDPGWRSRPNCRRDHRFRGGIWRSPTPRLVESDQASVPRRALTLGPNCFLIAS